MIRRLLLWFAFFAWVSAAAAQPAFVPLAAGPWGELNAKDGDAMFNTDYFASPDLSGPPAASRLEAAVGREPTKPTALTGTGYSVRWSGTLTPARDGLYPLALRSNGNALLTLDGKVLSPAGSNATVPSVEMRAGRPYEIVVEFRNPTGQDHVALEWAAPAPLAASAVATRTEFNAGPAAGTILGIAVTLENARYTLASEADGTLRLTEKSTGVTASFAPEFSVVYQTPGHETKMDPKGGKYLDDGPVGNTNYVVPSWDKETDYLVAAHPRTRLHASATQRTGTGLTWSFPAQEGYRLTANVELPTNGGEPSLTFHLTPTQDGQFSVGYVGAPRVAAADAAWIWQPLVWQDQRFPNRAYLTKEYECPIPFVMVGRQGTSVGVGADSREMPYRMPTNENSRFGVLVRNAAGEAQPQLFAPILGGPESRMKAGDTYSFALRLFVQRGAWFDGYKHLAQTLYAFNDVRENGLCSLNTTLENMTDYVLSDKFCYWYPQYKTWGYQNDGGPGAGRQQSAADALSLALVFDRRDFFERRSRPTLEYMLSRNTVSTKFSEPKFMGGFVNVPSDLSAAYRLTGSRTTAIRDVLLANAPKRPADSKRPNEKHNAVFDERNELNLALSYYRLTGDQTYLQSARAAADRYIAARVDQPAKSFGDLGSSFWPEMAPSYDLLYELYDDTREPRYLQAAAAAMRQFTAYTYLVPAIPDANFTANPGGKYNGQSVPEDIVPAWRVSANGLAAECAGTAHSHRGVYMASYASYLARLGRDTQEPFFTDIARNAVVGRYANYPSYAYRNGYTTVHQSADYPLHTFEEIKKFTSAHYNHPLPMTAFLVDYLVSDIYARSDAKISFPSDYTNTGAYFRNKVYGARPGKFYDDEGAFLWLPKGLVQADSIQVNYVAARGKNRLYLALANQSARAVTTAIALNPKWVSATGSHRARLWVNNQPAATISVVDGRAILTVPAKGLTALAIDDVTAQTEIQEAMLDPSVGALPAGSSRTEKTSFGDVTATPLRFGKALTSIHVWLKAGPEQVSHATLQTTVNGQVSRLESALFPYEFTVALPDDATSVVCEITVKTTDGKVVRAPALRVPLAAQ